ncbi:MAG: PH domain-containing protein [Myxococcales bacterium]|nr:PH domain-containing protein [Myxococcales bacterium]
MHTFTPLATRARLLFHLQAFSRLLLFWLPFCVVAGMVGAFTWQPLYAATAATSLLFLRFLIAVWWPWLSWRRWGWTLRDGELLIARGVLFRSITAIPMERVQHVDVRQGPLEQWLDLARVHVHTASGLGADGVVPGLVHRVAEELRDALVKAAAEGDDGV